MAEKVSRSGIIAALVAPFAAIGSAVKLIRMWWRRYSDWRIVTLLVIVAVFSGMIVMPSAVAVSFHRGSGFSSLDAWLNSSDEQLSIRVYRVENHDVVSMPLGEYLIDVLAAELPPNAPPQALQAAAVAARTYAVQAMMSNRITVLTGTGSSGGTSSALNSDTNSTGGNRSRAAGSSNSASPSKAKGTSNSASPSKAKGTSNSANSSNAKGTSNSTSNSTNPLSSATSSNVAANSSSASPSSADVTDSGQWDLPMLMASGQDAKWGSQVDDVRSKYEAAVLATDGLVVTYQNKPILAFSFELSPGATRSAQEVFHKSIPYLQAIACPDDMAVAQQPVQSFTAAELAKALNIPMNGPTSSSSSGKSGSGSGHSGASGSSGSSSGSSAGRSSSGSSSSSGGAGTGSTSPAPNFKLTDFKVANTTSGGFVIGVTGPGGRTWSGSDFAKALGLPSSNFSFEVSGGKLLVYPLGIGEDVGLSLHEATVLAGRGAAWQQIVARFYPGTEVAPDVNFNLGAQHS